MQMIHPDEEAHLQKTFKSQIPIQVKDIYKKPKIHKFLGEERAT